MVYVPIHRMHPFHDPPAHSTAPIVGRSADGLTRSCVRSGGSGSTVPPPRHLPPSARSRPRSCGCRRGRQTRAPHAKHSHNAPQVSGYPASAGPPTIAVAALLRLSRWCRQRSDVPGEASCGDEHPQQRPPARESGGPCQPDPAPLGPTLPRPAGPPRSPRRTVARPASPDGRPAGGQP
jgi:hypothetical protein